MTVAAKLWLIRHAETDLAGTFCGHANPPVNRRGHEQIESLVRSLQDQQIDTVYSSDLQRAITTADPIASYFSVPLHQTPHLREIGFGDWEALTWKQIEQLDPTYAQRWVNGYPTLSPPNGELFENFANRVLGIFDTLISQSQHAAVVTHSGVLRVILTRRCGYTDEQAWLQTKHYCSSFTYPIAEVCS